LDSDLGFSFEVKESDLLGRVGSIRAGGRRLETPCLLPVVHPINQAVPPEELKTMGFEGLMTNSYILNSRRRDEALTRGVHGLLQYDGMLMTDSGGYQVLEYGDLDIGFREVAKFQSDIGSDFAVTLDRPTGYPQNRKVARETVEYSLKNAKATLSEFGDSDTVWVGPVQGGLHLDLVKKSASSMVKAGFEFLALGSPVQIMQNYMFADLVRMIVAARKSVPYSVPMHLFGAGHPLTMAMAVALGCDTFDSASYILFARKGKYMGRSGVTSIESMRFLPCSCPVCARSSVGEMLELEAAERTRALSLHNLYILRQEVESCKEAIVEGRLWDLVEEKSMSHPRLREAFMVFSELGALFAEGTAAAKGRGLFVRTEEDMNRPEVIIARERLKGAGRRSAEGAAVAASSEPRRRRNTRGTKGKREREIDIYKIHPVLGLYPAELEFAYPFSQAVTAAGITRPPGRADIIRELKKMGYRSVRVGAVREKPMVRSRRSRRGASPSARSS
jgi:7-cyano-7-deazaguanine tRNA-ribosyltransferase